MAKKSTVVYTLDLLVHVDLAEGTSFKAMQDAVKDIKAIIGCLSTQSDTVHSITVDKTIIQKKVTY